MIYEDRQYQIDASDAVFKYLDKHSQGHPLVALPTGAGKTAVMAKIVARIFKREPLAKIVVVSHDSRILQQNAAGLESIHKVYINSASLGRREVGKLTVAGIQSVYKSKEFKAFSHVIIDEAHTIPQAENSMYRQFFDSIGAHTRIGLTATPYRTGQCYIIGEDHMFDKKVIDLTFGAKFTKLVKDGYLSPLIINSTHIQLDTEGVATQAGDFNIKEMSTKFNRESITRAALKEMIEKGKGRKKWLIFAIDIDHAENIVDILNSMNVFAMPVHSKNEFDNDRILNLYKRDMLHCIVNVGMLTTGFDAPNIDLIGLLRPTKSAGLHVQMIGRGLRVADGKDDCLVLDYAGNTERLGPINRVVPYIKGEGKATGEPITKTCEVCDTIVAPNVKICPKCGTEFKFKQLIGSTSAELDIIADSAVKWFKVDSVSARVHNSKAGNTLIKVTYTCGLRSFNEWVSPHNKGYAGARANQWLKQRELENNTDIRLLVDQIGHAKEPKRISVKTDSKYPEVLKCEF